MKNIRFLLLAFVPAIAASCCCQDTDVPRLPKEPKFQDMNPAPVDEVIPVSPVKGSK